jgi:sigma-B regulation protein RsbU (phosphoserine phosphatase)
MLSSDNFGSLLHDLAQIERPHRSDNTFTPQSKLILDAFVRHSGAEHGALYLGSADDPVFQLAAKTELLTVPEQLGRPGDEEVADGAAMLGQERCMLVPIALTRGNEGFIALCGDGAPDDPKLLHAASEYLTALTERRRMEVEMREGEFQLKYRLWELESLYDIGLSIASTLNLDELADQILIRTMSLLNARSAALYLKKDDRFALHRSFGEVRSYFFDEEMEPDQLCELVDKGCTIQLDAEADCIFPGCETFVALPIRGNREVIGVLAAADRELRDGGVGAFQESDVRLLSQFATQAAIALENARLHKEALEKQAMERELELASTIQLDILPREIPNTPPLEVAALAKPARHVGGDYYTFLERDGDLSLCVADVSGKSVGAALLVSALHAALQLLLDEGRDLGTIATELNRHIHRWSAENKFVTMVLATIDPEAGVIRYVNAGHNPAFIVANGEVHALHSHGLPIGLLPQSRYSVQTAQFAPGSLLAVYSDGISEAENAQDEEFGEQGLQNLLLANASEPCQTLAQRVSAAVEEFVGDLPQKDDQTLVLVRHTSA